MEREVTGLTYHAMWVVSLWLKNKTNLDSQHWSTPALCPDMKTQDHIQQLIQRLNNKSVRRPCASMGVQDNMDLVHGKVC